MTIKIKTVRFEMLVLIDLLLCPIWSISCLAHNNSPTVENAYLFKTWSIPPKIMAPEPAPRRKDKFESVCTGKRWPDFVYLARPGENNFVAVVKFEPGSPAILDPEGFDYGPVPLLVNLTQAQANILWGLPISSNSSTISTYRLTTFNEQEFFLDVRFRANKIEKYRLRSKTFETYDRSIPEDGKRLSGWQQIKASV